MIHCTPHPDHTPHCAKGRRAEFTIPLGGLRMVRVTKSQFGWGLAVLLGTALSAFAGEYTGEEKKDDAKVVPLAAQSGMDTKPAVTDTDFGHLTFSVTDPAKAGEVEKAVRAVFAAFNKRDADAFLAGWTDTGLRETFGESKEAAKRFFPHLRALSSLEPFTVGGFSHTAVGGDTATTEVELAQGNLKKTHRLSLVKENDTWKIGSDKEIAAKIPADATLIPVTMREFAFEFDSSAVSVVTRNVAFKVSNTTGQKHDFSVMILRADSDMEVLLGQAGPLEVGEEKTVLLMDLEPGRYVILCNRLHTDGQPYSSKGMRAEFTIPSLASPPESQPSEDEAAQPEGESEGIAPQ